MALTKHSIELWISKSFGEHEIADLEVLNEEEFHLILRCKLGKEKPERFCKNFIAKFSAFTLTDWIVKNTFPSVKRLVFRKLYSCHLTRINKAKQNSRKNENCNASINIKVKKVNRNTRKNDPLLQRKLDVAIEVNFVHSHPVRTAEAYGQLRCSTNTMKTFIKYFELNMLPPVAKTFNELVIKISNPNNNETQLLNAQINPKPRTIKYYYDKWRAEKRDYEFDSIEKLYEVRQEFKKWGRFLSISEDPKVIVVLTPITERAFSEFGDDAFIHSSCCSNTETAYVTTVFVPTNIGPIPIGYIMHNATTEEEYQQGFIQLSFALVEYCGKPFEAKNIIINNGEQLEEFERIFPNSVVEICPYTNFNDFWKILSDPMNSYSSDDRKLLMRRFCLAMNANTKEECETHFKKILCNPKLNMNFDLTAKIEKIFARIHTGDWRSGQKVIGFPLSPNLSNLQNNFTSILMRIYKDVVAGSFDDYNCYTLVLMFANIMEKVYFEYLMQFVNSAPTITPLFSAFLEKQHNFNILLVEPNEYLIQSLSELDRLYTVYTDIVYCTCPAGSDGLFCMHLSAVEQEFPFLHTPTATKEERELYHRIAGDGVTYCLDFEGVNEFNLSATNNGDLNNADQLNDNPSHHSDCDDGMDRDDDMVENVDLKKEAVPLEKIPKFMKHLKGNEDRSRKKLDQLTTEIVSITDALEKNANTQHKSIKKIIDNLKNMINSDETVDPEIDSTTAIPSTSKSRRLKKSHEVPPQLSQMSSDEADIVSKGWALIYKRLKPDQQLYAKKAVDDILFEATLGSLKRDSVVIKPSSGSELPDCDPFDIKYEYCNTYED